MRIISMIFISHDLSVVYHICDTIQVMYYGKIVESGSTEAIFSNPIHPYTRVLLESIPIANPKKRRTRMLSYAEQLVISKDLVGSSYDFPLSKQETEETELYEIESGHVVRCVRR